MWTAVSWHKSQYVQCHPHTRKAPVLGVGGWGVVVGGGGGGGGGGNCHTSSFKGTGI